MTRSTDMGQATRALEIARRLVAFNTTVGDPGHEPIEELECQRFIADLLVDAGFEVDLWEPEVAALRGHPMYLDGQNWERRPIVVGRLRGTGGGRSLMLNGHIDTVPAGNLRDWSSNPWSPDVRSGRLYGRGACDMKGGVAAMLDAALTIAEAPRLAGDLLVATVTDEEVNGLGTIAALERGYRADAAIVPEPTDLDVYLAFRGILVAELELIGRKGHVEIAQPHWSQGGAVNAIHHMVRAVTWLRELNEQWRDLPAKQHPLCSTPEVHVTTIDGGDFYANVPDRCTATLDVCYLPGETDPAGSGGYVKAEIERHLARLATGWLAECPPRMRWIVDYPPAEIDADADLVRELSATVSQVIGREPRLLGLDTWDDTASLILAGIPAVSFGPGSNERAHAIDEYVPLNELAGCAETIVGFARAWCAVTGDDKEGPPPTAGRGRPDEVL